jgi:hypothetical protein
VNLPLQRRLYLTVCLIKHVLPIYRKSTVILQVCESENTTVFWSVIRYISQFHIFTSPLYWFGSEPTTSAPHSCLLAFLLQKMVSALAGQFWTTRKSFHLHFCFVLYFYWKRVAGQPNSVWNCNLLLISGSFNRGSRIAVLNSVEAMYVQTSGPVGRNERREGIEVDEGET